MDQEDVREEFSELERKYNKLKKKMKKMKKIGKTNSMVKDLHKDRFNHYDIKECVGINDRKSDDRIDEETEQKVKSFIDLLMEYPNVTENVRLDVYDDSVTISGSGYNNDPLNNNNRLDDDIEHYFEIYIQENGVSFEGSVFTGLRNHYRIKSDIFDIYYLRLRALSDIKKSESVRIGFDTIFRITNLNRGRAMAELENNI